ncbi:selenophosphate synthase [Thermodesulfitimonas autotrophica]|uniref:Selenide, water dikinase n=1 Tax=Thermodesulfitimonas autotrophica TaxID=1894989 RepID=A0A3N5AU32_9THEO|nr:selenophosphate synthase [Thermodesulfitimonas autotrophica]
MGIETGDDAGVYLLTDEFALIQTVDFFTPVVDDPYLYGQIAAANALSDVYAMGGQPLTALNIICYPTGCGEFETLAAILRGGADKITEAGALLVGGHSVEDKEPKYGLAVTGLVHPAKLVTNRGAREGDLLVLTKRIGTGVITTALKADLAPAAAVEEACREMATLNRAAAAAMQEVGVSACTDITGFGLLGHALALARASAVHLTLNAAAVPLLPEAWELAASGLLPAGAYANRDYVAPCVSFAAGVPEVLRDLLCDPQTSGGLLIAVPPDRINLLLAALKSRAVATAAVVGSVTAGDAGTITVVYEP